MKTLDEILAEIGEESAAVITAAIDSEKNKGIEVSRKKGADVTKFMTEANRLKDLIRVIGLDPAGNIEEQLSEMKAKLEANGGNASSNGAPKFADSQEFKSMQRQLTQITAALEAEKKEKLQATEKYTKTKLSEALRKGFGDTVRGAGLAIENLIYSNKVKLNANDEVVFVNGDEEFTLDEGIQDFKKKNPDLVNNTQTPGGGSAPGGKPKNKQMLISDFDKLDLKAKAAFLDSGGALKE